MLWFCKIISVGTFVGDDKEHAKKVIMFLNQLTLAGADKILLDSHSNFEKVMTGGSLPVQVTYIYYCADHEIE